MIMKTNWKAVPRTKTVFAIASTMPRRTTPATITRRADRKAMRKHKEQQRRGEV